MNDIPVDPRKPPRVCGTCIHFELKFTNNLGKCNFHKTWPATYRVDADNSCVYCNKGELNGV